jgi:hypothetical protein
MSEIGRDQQWRQTPQSELSACLRQALLVLGMHRSGTSALGGTIEALGVTAPRNLAEADRWNPRGYFESPRIFAAHDSLLAAVGSSWDDWRPLDPQWLAANAGPHRQALKQFIEDEFGAAPLIFLKDPRVCRFVPLVRSILAELHIDSVAVLLIRNPLEVAQSLGRRDKFALSKSNLLWLRHTLDAEYASRDMPRSFLTYADLLAGWRPQMQRVAEATGIAWPISFESSQAKIDAFLCADLRRERTAFDQADDGPEMMPLVRDTYKVLLRIVADGDSAAGRDRLDFFRATFDEACRTFAPVLADQAEAKRAIAAERDALKAELNALAPTTGNFLRHVRLN